MAWLKTERTVTQLLIAVLSDTSLVEIRCALNRLRTFWVNSAKGMSLLRKSFKCFTFDFSEFQRLNFPSSFKRWIYKSAYLKTVSPDFGLIFCLTDFAETTGFKVSSSSDFSVASATFLIR